MLIFYISLLHLSGICECQQGQMSCELSLDLAAQLAVLQHVAWFLTTQSWCIISYFLQLIVMHYFSYHLLFSFLLFAVCPTSPSSSLLESLALQQQEQDPTNLYISNLPVSMDEQELENMLKPLGHVISTRILRDANGVSRGVGFAR